MQIRSTQDTSHAHAPSSLSKEQLCALYEDLNNPHSFWQELRITPMSGVDYLFIPQFVYQAFGGSYTIARFMVELASAFDIEPSRLQIICVNDNPNSQWQYAKGVVEWSVQGVTHSHLEDIVADSPFNEFIGAMFKHSASLTEKQPH